jgi:deoxycytidine triphosphate deaminase
MSVLSNVDLENELISGKNIRIYPLNQENIKGSTYNLTASEYAWSLYSKKSLVQGNKIIIPPNDSALIVTKEVLWVSSKICGSYHSKVSVVSVGGGHIGTTLDPEWIGHSLITIHNHNPEQPLKIGINDTFVSVMFHYLNKSSTIEQSNKPSQLNYLYRIIPDISTDCHQYFDESWKSQPTALLKKMKTGSESQYDLIKDERKKKNSGFNLLFFWIVVAVILLLSIYGIYVFEEGTILYILSFFVAFVGFSGTFGIIGKEVYDKIK